MHSPRIIGATTLFASGKVTDMHMKSKGRWAGDIAYIYARFCPEMDREAVRAKGQTDASPFSWNALIHTGPHYQDDGPRMQQTWVMTKSLTTAMKRFLTTKTIGAIGGVTRGSGHFCACAWDVMSFGVITPMTPRATRARVTPPLKTTSLPRFIVCLAKTSHTAGKVT